MVDGEARGGDARGHVQLVVDGAHVLTDGARANGEAIAHVGVGEPLRDEPRFLELLERLELPPVQRRARDQPRTALRR